MNTPEEVRKLEADLQLFWEATAERALKEGYTEAQAAAIAWTATNWHRGVESWRTEIGIYWRYPLARPGKYTPTGAAEAITITAKDTELLAEALNHLADIGHPCPLIFGHDSEYPIGTIPAATMDGDTTDGCLVYRAEYEEGIRTGAFGLSMESWRNFSDPAYTDGKEYPLFPSAWAVLPANQLPAIPPGEPLAAGKTPKELVSIRLAAKAPDRGQPPHGKEAYAMTLEQMQKEIEALKTENASLKAQTTELGTQLQAVTQERDELKTADEAAKLEARKAAYETRKKALMESEPRTGIRAKIEERLKAGKDLEEQERILASLETLHETFTPPSGKLNAGKADPDTGDPEETAAEKAGSERIKAARELQAKEGIPYLEALKRTQAKDATTEAGKE